MITHSHVHRAQKVQCQYLKAQKSVRKLMNIMPRPTDAIMRIISIKPIAECVAIADLQITVRFVNKIK